jgi:hypothetical protein
VRALLAAGADPNVPKHPGGETAIEMALSRSCTTTTNAAKAAQIVGRPQAADPRTTLHARLKEDLAADPSTWTNLQQARARERFIERREALVRLPARERRSPDARIRASSASSNRETPLRLR